MTTVNICGHPERKHQAKGRCASCYTRWHEQQNGQSGNAWLKAHPERARWHHWKANLRKNYGLSVKQFETMWFEQNGRCANPGCSFIAAPGARGVKGLHVDHDHATGKVRGLLCKPCNTALGQVEDKPKRLSGLISYLAVN
jgi:hypothetical protein